MKPGWVVALLLACALGGCASSGGGSQNPNLLAPKLLVHPRPDANATLYVHGAFGEQVYEWIAVSVDNATLGNRTLAFSFEATVPGTGFFLEVSAGTGEQHYLSRARLDLDIEEDRVMVATLDDDGWREARAFSLPYELILDRPKVSG